MPRTLIIGYGNPLRGDDAAGCIAAYELEQRFHDDPEVEVITAQQLTPEMVDDVARSRFVLFIDASWGDEPGTIRQTQVEPDATPYGFTHHVTPASLLAGAEQLYGDAPPGVCITVAGWSFELSNKLSRGLRLRLPELVRQAAEIVNAERGANAVGSAPG